MFRDSIINTGTELRNILLDRSLLGEDVRFTGKPGKLNVGDNTLIEMD